MRRRWRRPHRTPRRKLIEAAESALQLLGVGLFLTLLLRERRFIGGALLLLIGGALLAKGVAAVLMLKPAVWETWLKPGVSIGMAGGALILLFTVFLPRAVQVATCATALLASLLLPLLAVDVPTRARAPHAVQLALRTSAQFQRADAVRAPRVADRRRGVAVRARRPAGVGRTRMMAQRRRL